jgi:hypothetical protein
VFLIEKTKEKGNRKATTRKLNKVKAEVNTSKKGAWDFGVLHLHLFIAAAMVALFRACTVFG